MATVTDKLTPKQVNDACRLYVARNHRRKNLPVPDDVDLLGQPGNHLMKNDANGEPQPLPADAFDYMIVTYDV